MLAFGNRLPTIKETSFRFTLTLHIKYRLNAYSMN